MKVINHREFANGQVFALKLDDGFLIETTDTFLPFYTKDAASQHDNALHSKYWVGDRSERWMVGVSTMSGCPVKCKFCAAGKLKKWRNLEAHEIIDQVYFVLEQNHNNDPGYCREFKINYTRMGEPFLNIDNVKRAIASITKWRPLTHHYVSTIGLKGSDFSWIKDNITLQISLHSLDEERRKWLIPINNLMTLDELGAIRTGSKLKTTINLTLVDEKDFDIKKLKKYFNPDYFFIKLSPINENEISKGNDLGKGVIEQLNLV